MYMSPAKSSTIDGKRLDLVCIVENIRGEAIAMKSEIMDNRSRIAALRINLQS